MFYFSRANGADSRTPSPLLLFFPPISSFNAQIKQQVSKIRVFILPKMGSVEWLQTSRPTDGLPSPARPSLFTFRLFPTSVQFPTRNPVRSKQSFGLSSTSWNCLLLSTSTAASFDLAFHSAKSAIPHSLS